jgi:hypothetical protein
VTQLRPATGLLLLLLASPARADLGGRRAGFWGDVGAGLGVADRPWSPGVGWTIAAGGWFGRYDDSFAIGRRVDVGVRLRQDFLLASGSEPSSRDRLLSAPMIEARRGIDLLVVALRFGGSAGPLIRYDLGDPTSVDVGGTVRANGAVGWRFDPRASLMLRLEAGIDVLDQKVAPTLGLTLGIEVAAPGRKRPAESDDAG